MARYISFTCLILTVFVIGTHQAPYHPYLNPYMQPYASPYAQARFNFNALLVSTLTTTTQITTTSTTTVTCTKSTSPACDTANAANTLRYPFYNGIQKRSLEQRDFEDLEPSQVASVEPTAVPEAKMSRTSDPIFYSPYGMLDSSISREIPPFEAGQAKLFFGTTITLSLTTTSVTTTTRTLTPNCSTAGWFSQCP